MNNTNCPFHSQAIIISTVLMMIALVADVRAGYLSGIGGGGGK